MIPYEVSLITSSLIESEQPSDPDAARSRSHSFLVVKTRSEASPDLCRLAQVLKQTPQSDHQLSECLPISRHSQTQPRFSRATKIVFAVCLCLWQPIYTLSKLVSAWLKHLTRKGRLKTIPKGTPTPDLTTPRKKEAQHRHSKRCRAL
jgi:hypothetical protein